jgi:hypothetical protein
MPKNLFYNSFVMNWFSDISDLFIIEYIANMGQKMLSDFSRKF